MVDPVALTQALVRCPSVTPAEAGALQHLEAVLSEAGFTCVRVDRGKVSNLFARWGDRGHAKTFGFNGHTDVVPLGDEAAWTKPPFGAEIEGDWLYGRGATDMKSGVAAFAAAAIDFVKETPPDGAVILTITGDEEGDAVDGTVALLDWMEVNGEAMDVCIVGEPTCRETMGDMMKIGRRGSMTAYFEVTGKQGHSAYVDRTINPVHAMVDLAGRLTAEPLDAGTDQFAPSTLSFTTIDVGNTASNVIPAKCRATCNIRFNDLHWGASLSDWINVHAAAVAKERGVTVDVTFKISGESFVTPPGHLSDMVAAAVRAEVQGAEPELSTTGGTSDARFVKAHCPVVEFGLVGHRMHQVDERVSVAEIGQLKRIYTRMLQRYFA